MLVRCHSRKRRRGASVIEFGVLLPFLVFLFAAGVDFARVFHYFLTLTNCARAGALYASKDATSWTDKAGIEKAAIADANGMSPAPQVSAALASDETGNLCVRVTVTWSFSTLSRFPGVPNTMELSRTVQMRVPPTDPKDYGQ